MTVTPDTDYRVGLDLARIGDVAEAVDRHGDRYLQRVFTDHELACCRREHGYSHASLAARWAAKEAAIKVLRPPAERPEWRSIEVRRSDDGACALCLTGTAETLAQAAGITSLSVSLTHEEPYAAAIVLAVCGPPPNTTNGNERNSR